MIEGFSREKGEAPQLICSTRSQRKHGITVDSRPDLGGLVNRVAFHGMETGGTEGH